MSTSVTEGLSEADLGEVPASAVPVAGEAELAGGGETGEHHTHGSAAVVRARGKGRRFPPEVLTPEEVRRLIGAASPRAPSGVRNRALLAVLYRGGLRLGEALALHPKDVDVAQGTISVLHGKGDRFRVVGVDPGALALVERWREVRRRLRLSTRRPLFCTLGGEPLEQSYVRHLLPRLARKAGVEKRVHAHGLRHTHAAELAREGKAMNLIQDQLGHDNLATTSRYLRHVAPAERIETIRAREWYL